MIDISASQRQKIATYKEMLARLEREESLLGDRPERLGKEERTKEIADLRALIARMEEGNA